MSEPSYLAQLKQVPGPWDLSTYIKQNVSEDRVTLHKTTHSNEFQRLGQWAQAQPTGLKTSSVTLQAWAGTWPLKPCEGRRASELGAQPEPERLHCYF